MRRAAKVDDNHKSIVQTFRACGWEVLDISQLKNCCDLFVSKAGHTIAIEIKDGSKSPSRWKLTEGEEAFRLRWKGRYEVVLSDEDVLRISKGLT